MKSVVYVCKCCHFPVLDHFRDSFYCPLCDEIIPASEAEEETPLTAARKLWSGFGDIPMNPETECIEESWLKFPAGTHREEIWHWFEETFGVSVAEDLMFCEDESDNSEDRSSGEEPETVMKLTRAQVSTLNKIAKIDFQKAQAMLDGINLVLDTQYGWLAKRVVWFENPNSSVAERYAHVHDAYGWGE